MASGTRAAADQGSGVRTTSHGKRRTREASHGGEASALRTMDPARSASVLPHIVWVYPEPLASALDSATWLETTRTLRELGWPVTLVVQGPAGQHCLQGVEVCCVPKPQVYVVGVCVFHMRFLRYLFRRRGTVDAILFHQMSAPWLLPLRSVRSLVGWQRPVLVMDTRDLVAAEGTLRSWLRSRFFRMAHFLANRWADGQTAITARMAKLVDIPPSRLWGIWPSGVDLERFTPARVGRQWPREGELIRLIYVGKLDNERNPWPLCRAVEQANADGMAFELSLVGEGPARLALEGFGQRTEGRVRVWPAVPHDRVPGLLNEAHVGVTSLPSSGNEKFGASSPIKLFEYMAAGLPVLATNNACHTEVVGGDTFAFWVEDVSEEGVLAALRQLWRARATLGEKGDAAAAAARAWTWQGAGRKLSSALERGLLRCPAPGTPRSTGPTPPEYGRLSEQLTPYDEARLSEKVTEVWDEGKRGD